MEVTDMEEKDYFHFAENDYLYWVDSLSILDFNSINYVPNSICWNAASIAERYLKYILSNQIKNNFINDKKTDDLLYSHNLRNICEKIMEIDSSFEFDIYDIKRLSDYYYEVKYPSDHSYDVTNKDILFCKKILEEIRYVTLKEKIKNDEKIDQGTS